GPPRPGLVRVRPHVALAAAPRGLRARLGRPGREGDPVAQRRDRRLVRSEQPVVKVWLHSTSDASPLAALLLSQILPVFSVVAPCQRGGAPNAAAALGTPGRLARLGATPDFHHGLLCCDV